MWLLLWCFVVVVVVVVAVVVAVVVVDVVVVVVVVVGVVVVVVVVGGGGGLGLCAPNGVRMRWGGCRLGITLGMLMGLSSGRSLV